jgi:hypothetical protein
MANPNPQLSNLKHFKSPDLECPGEILGVRVDPKDKEWLRQQSGGLSFNTRRAIALYRKLMENPDLLEKL